MKNVTEPLAFKFAFKKFKSVGYGKIPQNGNVKKIVFFFIGFWYENKFNNNNKFWGFHILIIQNRVYRKWKIESIFFFSRKVIYIKKI